MEFILDPPIGVGDLKLGMSREEMGIALQQFGTPKPFARGGGALGWTVQRPATIFTYCDDDGRTDAIEFGSPRRSGTDSVLYRDIDLFELPVKDVLSRLEAAGIAVTEEENGYSFTALDLVLALWRNGEPTDEDGMPKYFEAALIARPGYYG